MTKRIFANRARKPGDRCGRDISVLFRGDIRSGYVASSTTKATELATHIHCFVFYNLG